MTVKEVSEDHASWHWFKWYHNLLLNLKREIALLLICMIVVTR